MRRFAPETHLLQRDMFEWMGWYGPSRAVLLSFICLCVEDLLLDIGSSVPDAE